MQSAHLPPRPILLHTPPAFSFHGIRPHARNIVHEALDILIVGSDTEAVVAAFVGLHSLHLQELAR